jgi:predicted  nucleic acid-binding Zn-ribbon protein
MSKVINDQIQKTENLIVGLRNNLAQVKGFMIDEQSINELESDISTLNVTNQKLERLLEEARPISKDATAKLADVKTKFMALKKKVKLNVDPSKWEQFGIADKR